MSHKILTGAFSLVLVGVGAWLYNAQKPVSTATTRPASTHREDELQAQLSQLAVEVQQLKAASAEQPAEPSPARLTQPAVVPPERQAAAPALPDPEDQLRAVEERTQQHFQALSRSFEAEPNDAQWSQSAQQELQGAYEGGEFHGAKVEVTCKTTFCRLNVNLNGVGQPQVAARLLSMRGPWSAPSLFKIDTVNNQIEYYVARAEYELPREN